MSPLTSRVMPADATVKYDLARFGLPGLFRRRQREQHGLTVNTSPAATASMHATGEQDAGLLPRRPSASTSLWARFAVPFLSWLTCRITKRNPTPPSRSIISPFAYPGAPCIRSDVSAGKVTGLIRHKWFRKSTLLKMLGVISHRPRATFCWMTSRWRAGAVRPLPGWPICRNGCPQAEGMTVRELVPDWTLSVARCARAFGVADRKWKAIALVGLNRWRTVWWIARPVASVSAHGSQCWWRRTAAACCSDEPTSALDIAHQVDVLALVHRLSQRAA